MATVESGLCMGCMEPLGAEPVCPHCGYENGGDYDKNYKRPGSLVGGRYLVGRLARKNGEGATYIAYDNERKKKVWLREYFPRGLAHRDLFTGAVVPEQERGAQYKALLSDFADVCTQQRRLVSTDAVIPIENALQEGNTIYAVYRCMRVVPLETYLVRHGGRVAFSQARQMLLPVCNALSVLHSLGGLHRGVSPFTVYADENGKLFLWDFSLSAVRTAGSELEAELFNGYSAPEQYSPSGWQGEWTDVYAVAALLYRMVSGFVPPKSTLVGKGRPVAPLLDLADVSAGVSAAVEEAMRASTQERTQTMAAFTAKLLDSPLSNTAVFDSRQIQRAAPAPPPEPGPERGSSGKYVALGLVVTVVALLGFVVLFMTTSYPELVSGREPSSAPAVSQSVPDSQPEASGESAQAPSVSEAQEEDKTVPRFVGQKLSEIDMQQYAERFTISVQEEYNSTYEAGVVYDQSPVEGTTMLNKGTVILYVSKGKHMVTMPDVLGKTREEAMRLLGEHDIAYTEFERVVPGAEPGTIVGTTPEPGTEFDLEADPVYVFYMPEQSVPEADDVKEASSRMTVEEFERNW